MLNHLRLKTGVDCVVGTHILCSKMKQENEKGSHSGRKQNKKRTEKTTSTCRQLNWTRYRRWNNEITSPLITMILSAFTEG
ncbi:MAG: hypothetical protein CMJ77_17135 [Planctomycetaceae bacterium]|nr:hypothetical protein [Planctomycetaceae bacterium]